MLPDRVSPAWHPLQNRGLALVEEARLGLADLFVVADDFNIRRRQQEHLVCDPLDAAAKSEDQPGREVDEPLRVRLTPVSGG